MGTKNNYIEVNGKRYDANSGAEFVMPDSVATNSALSTPAPLTPRPTMHDVIRRQASPVKHHKQQASHTLMRTAVKKPVPALKRRVKAHASTDMLVKQSTHTIAPKQSVKQLDERRLRHAQHIPKSAAVSRFATQPMSDVHSTVSAPVQPAQRVSTHRVHPLHQNTKPQTTAELLQQAIQASQSHEQPAPKAARLSVSKRLVGMGALAMLSVAVLGFILAQNTSTLKLQLASAKAGFSVALPAYQPAGFHQAQLTYSAGQAAVNYVSNSDSRSYQVTEKASSWDSQTLHDQFVVQTGQSYDTVQATDRLIYVYGDSNATWVNGGVWYVVHSNGALSAHQLVQLATSL